MAASSRRRGLAAAGTAAWQLLGIGALVVATWWLAQRVMPVLLPGAVAILLAALVRPLAGRLERTGLPRPLAAVASVAVLIVVQQVEGNLLYPMVVGPRMNLHPAVVLVSVTLGGALAGIPGAFLAVPIAIVCATALEQRASAGEPGDGRLSRSSSARKGARPATR